MAVEPVTSWPPRTVWLPTMWQKWADAVFIHWEVDPEAVASIMPQGVDVDTFEGRTYVALTGLRVRAGPPGLPAVPWAGVFPEVNVRVYSVDHLGRRGIMFCSLDAGRLVPAVAGRGGYRLPYAWATGGADRKQDLVSYELRRQWPRGDDAMTRFSCRIGPRTSGPTPLEHFMTARWVMHWSWFGKSMWGAAQHEPWPLHEAELLHLEDSLVATAGLAVLHDEPISVLYSPGVTARIGPPTPLGTRGPTVRRVGVAPPPLS